MISMKELINNSSVSDYLEKMFRQLNKDKFGGELETPIITIQSTPKAYGHITCSKIWKSVKGGSQYELNIAAESLNRPIANVVSTLLHEMVHLYNLMHGIQDCSRGETYHNKKFKAKAEEVGLIIKYNPKIGWSITEPGEELIQYINKKGWTDILINRSTVVSAGMRKPSSTRKYQCPDCGLSVRATKFVRIVCLECATELELCN